MEFGGSRKRGEDEGTSSGDGGSKRFKQAMGENPSPCACFLSLVKHLPFLVDFNASGSCEMFCIHGAAKLDFPCSPVNIALFACSPSGCRFGDECKFVHHFPGGIKAVTQLLGRNPALPAAPRHPVAPSFPDASAIQPLFCYRFNTAGGCMYGNRCYFLHSKHELGRPTMPFHRNLHAMEPIPPNLGAAAGFGASATVKISIDASMAGAVIGTGGTMAKKICRLTGVKLSIRDHESDPNVRNVELEGTFDQIRQASQMIHQLTIHVSASSVAGKKNPASSAPVKYYKTKLCDNFAKGPCNFGNQCLFAHGAEELRKPEKGLDVIVVPIDFSS
ncbi:Zinc finger CCCH domain-containing protein 44 [Sesamum angolense]|uniref:Zinc finger CCCH domain-containing protein 44 n=1 Tax=Sesamum angolense TaxID=2727404 RepID=A0AAE1X8R5_9LAMI|nr:Zinc finger CCCH domain-containing protein 44 [Sesamum angolense]